MDFSSAKPVDVIITESCRLDSGHTDRGQIIQNMPADLAMELAGAGKCRLATPDAIKEVKAGIKAAAEQAAATAALPDPVSAAIASAVTAALKAAGIGAPAKATA
jgi:hypothetical protein